MRKKSWKYYAGIILVGALAGTLLGELIGFVLPAGVVRDFFLKAAHLNIGPFNIDLGFIRFTLGLFVKMNVVGLMGVLLASYILKWMD